MIQQDKRVPIVAAYAGMCAIWGTTWLAIKVSLHFVPPLVGVGLRFAISGALMYAVAAAFGALRPLREVPWKLVLVLSVFLFGLNYILTYAAESRLDSGLVAVLFGTLPFFMFGLGHFMTGERTTPRIWAGAAVAFAGVGFISLGGQVRGSPLYALAAIAAAAVSSFGNVYAKRHSHNDPLITLPPSMLIAGIVVGHRPAYRTRAMAASHHTPIARIASLHGHLRQRHRLLLKSLAAPPHPILDRRTLRAHHPRHRRHRRHHPRRRNLHLARTRRLRPRNNRHLDSPREGLK